MTIGSRVRIKEIECPKMIVFGVHSHTEFSVMYFNKKGTLKTKTILKSLLEKI